MRTESDMDLRGDGLDLDEGDGVREMPTKDLLTEFFDQAKVLLKEEVQLAKIEVRREAKRAGVSAGLMGGGTVLLHTGLLCFAGFLVALLALALPIWAAALIVTVLFVGGGAALALAGKKKLKQVDLKPEETIKTLKEDQEWLRSMMHGGTSRTRATV